MSDINEVRHLYLTHYLFAVCVHTRVCVPAHVCESFAMLFYLTLKKPKKHRLCFKST